MLRYPSWRAPARRRLLPRLAPKSIAQRSKIFEISGFVLRARQGAAVMLCALQGHMPTLWGKSAPQKRVRIPALWLRRGELNAYRFLCLRSPGKTVFPLLKRGLPPAPGKEAKGIDVSRVSTFYVRLSTRIFWDGTEDMWGKSRGAEAGRTPPPGIQTNRTACRHPHPGKCWRILSPAGICRMRA